MFVDSHAHLDMESFHQDLSSVLLRAAEHQVKQILTIGCVRQPGVESRNVLELMKDRPQISAAFGIHPHDAALFSKSLEKELTQLLKDSRVVGLGEIGLDFFYDHSPRLKQQEVFRRQVALARSAGIPIIIHSRQAEEETCRVLEEFFAREDSDSGVLHCFTGTWEMARFCLGLGFSISFGGIVTFPKSQALRDVAARVPPEQILIETDSPYLAPVPYRGKRNEPAFVVYVAEMLAKVTGRSRAEIGELTSRNFQRMFCA